MLFCSERFLVFFVIVFLAYWVMPWHRARVWFLLSASIYFYASWNRWLAFLVVGSSSLDYLLARGMEASQSPGRRRLYLAISLSANLGVLGYFKYANFFLRSLEDAVAGIGGNVSLPVLRVLLPIGISFYTFEAISYAVDVYRRRILAERSLANFLLFILFFPHLIAGPIVRGRDFLPQARRPKRWDGARLSLGAQYFLLGLVKKIAIADRLAMYVDPVFFAPHYYSTAAVWVATMAWVFQGYCDFSGYTDMALGAAHMLGYKLRPNFNMPYLSANIAEIWRRWHISLSTWLRDYVFFPLVRYGRGSRFPRLWSNGCILITMLVCGLWHGASWTFVVWGGLQGLLQIGHRRFRDWCEHWPTFSSILETAPGTVGRVALTFFVWSMTAVVFRASTVVGAGTIFQRLFLPSEGYGPPVALGCFWCALAAVALGHVLGQRPIREWLNQRAPAPLLGFTYATALTAALFFAPIAGRAFVYFQF